MAVNPVQEHAVGAELDRLTSPTSTPLAPIDENVGKTVLEMLRRSKRSSAQIRKTWPANYDFIVAGRQWNQDRPAWRFSEVINLSLSTILTEIGIQTDARPKTDYVPQEPSDIQFCEILKKINDANWSKPSICGFGWQEKLAEHIFDVKYADVSFAEICWDPALADGIGDIGWRVLDPTYCFWDPMAADMKEARYFIYLEPTPTQKLKEQYPERASEIKADITGLGDGADQWNVDFAVDRLRTSTTQQEHGEKYVSNDKYGGEDMTLKIRCWMRDGTLEEIKEEIENVNGKEVQYVQKLKFPKGRYVEMAGTVVLKDTHNGVEINGQVTPYEDGEFPIACLVNYKLPRRINGLSEAPFVRPVNKIVNYVWSHILDQMKMAGNPKAVVTHSAQDIVDQITNEPGLVLEVPSQDSIRFEPGMPIGAGHFNILEMSMSLFDKVQGLGEVARGTPQASVTSGLQLEGFVEAAQTRPRLKNRNVDSFLSQVGYLQLSRILQFYTAPRVYRITNDENYPEHVEFYISDGATGKVANIKTTQVSPEGQVVGEQRQAVEVRGMPDVRVTSGSSLPFARSQKATMAQAAIQVGAIDRLEYLKAVEWPNAEAVDQRLGQKEQEMAAMQPPPGAK